MSGLAPHSLFSRFGVELEYMIVDADTLDVRPIADELLAEAASDDSGDVDRGKISWSNELVAHVVELKVSEPAVELSALPALFLENIREVNARLAARGARLMPSAMHPWMDPLRETRLWPHEYGEVYRTFDRIFGCQGHGWSNLQSVHLNLPFANDEEFARLHAAIRLVLPILPALAASSPIVERRATGLMDNRLEAYRRNSAKIPAVAGRVVPEAVFSRADYESRILQPLYAAIAAHDPEGTLQHEWLNARGAIARFTRGAIEIRVLDVQECPLADLAICAAVVAVLQTLVAEHWSSLARQQMAAVEPLAEILLATIRDAEQATIENREYLWLFGYRGHSASAGDLWRHLIAEVPEIGRPSSPWHGALATILTQGPLARRILAATGAGTLATTYAKLSDSLQAGAMFRS